jgi:phosphate-selective porin
MRKLFALTALLLVAPAASQALSPERAGDTRVTPASTDARAAMGSARAYWDNGTRIDFPDSGFTVRINSLLQPRYTFTDNDFDTGNDRNNSSFDTNRARLMVSGTALHEEFSYGLNVDFAGQRDVYGFGDGSRGAELLDAWIQWHACDWLGLSMGQFKTAVSRQWNTNPAYLQFPDRSFISDYSNSSRAQGLAANMDFGDGRFELGAGLFNGWTSGQNTQNFDTRHTAVINARFNPMGEMNAYEEGDINWTEDMALSFGAAYSYSETSELAGIGKIDVHQLSVDANVKVRGLSFHGEFFLNELNPDIGSSWTPVGGYAQVGYFLSPKVWELALRYSYVDFDDTVIADQGAPVSNLNQVSASLNHHWWEHNLKAQIAYDFFNRDLAAGAGNDNTHRWMLQLSSYF